MSEALRGCPFCGGVPALVRGEEDRDLHPSLPWLQYVCAGGRDSHAVRGPRAVSPYLNWTHETGELEEMARAGWNSRDETAWFGRYERTAT